MSQRKTYTALPHEKLVQMKQEKRIFNKVTPHTFQWNISTT